MRGENGYDKESKYILEPFLHFERGSIYNPLTNIRIPESHDLYEIIHNLYHRNSDSKSKEYQDTLIQHHWMVSNKQNLLKRYFLRAVNIEGNAHCNQRCYFCPVSLSPKDAHTMDLVFYEEIVKQLSDYHHTIEAVFMSNYNEPTADKYFIDRIAILKKYDLPVCINTNATGLTKERIDKIMDRGTLRLLSVNFSTLDAQQYRHDRKWNKLAQIMDNLNYAKSFPIASEMNIAVLGENDETHRNNYQEISAAFKDSHFEVRDFPLRDRGGSLEVGDGLMEPIEHLAGCENLGSRPVQHLHINSYGECILCCEDYYETHKVGNLKDQTVEEVLTGEAMQDLRAKIYGLKEASDDFICRRCVCAISCQKKDRHHDS